MIKALQLCLIIALIGSASAAATVCKDVPFLTQLKAFAVLSKDVGTTAAADYTAWETAIANVEKITDDGVALGADMTYCTNGKNTKKSCCVVDTETAIQKLIRRTFEYRLKTLPISLGNLKKVIDDSSACIGKTVATEIITAMVPEITKQEAARTLGIKAEINWLRGQACAICHDTTDQDLVWKSDKFQVLQASIDSYTTAMTASNVAFNTANTTLKTLLESTLTAKAATCTTLLAAVTKSFTDGDYALKATALACETSTIFGAAVDKQYGGCIRFQEYGYDSTKTIATAFAANAATTESMYLTNAADDTVFDAIASTYKDDVVKTLPAMTTTKTDTTKTTTDTTDTNKDDDSSSTVLYVSALLALFLVLL